MDLQVLQNKLHFTPRDQRLLEQAFVHRSYLNEHPHCRWHNERLEFLGDAVLELVITHSLYTSFPDKDEGELTSIRSALVRKESLARLAHQLQFGDHLMLSRGEEASGGRQKDYILANTVEAFIGYLYLDQGYDRAAEFINHYITAGVEQILSEKLYIDAKSSFQEIAQDRLGITPTYEVLEQSGPDHNRSFIMGAFLRDRQVGQGQGSSKKKAQDEAARDALNHQAEWLPGQ